MSTLLAVWVVLVGVCVAIWSVIMYTTPINDSDRRFWARMTLAAPAWPLVLIAFLAYWARKGIRALPGLLRDAELPNKGGSIPIRREKKFMATSITLTLTEAEARRLVDVNLVNDFTDVGRALRNRLIASLPPVPVKCPVCYRSGSFTTTQNALIAHLVHDHHYEDDRDWYREESAQTYAWRAFHEQTYCPVQGHHLNH